MNVVERLFDNADPSISVRLRALKNWWRNDQVMRVMTTLVPAGSVAIDVGANRGVYTYLLSARVGPLGRVHSVEPYPGNVARLRVLARRRGNITFHPVAVSDAAGEATLHVPVHDGKHIHALSTLGSVRGTGHEDFQIPVRTLDELLVGERGRITLLKCDVEGHEDLVLRGATATLREHMPAIVIEIEQRHRKDPIHDTFSHLLGLGYVGYFLASSGLRPLSEFDVEIHQLSSLTADFVAYDMPDGYVNDFLFVRPGTDLGRLVSKQDAPPATPAATTGAIDQPPVRLPRPRKGEGVEQPISLLAAARAYRKRRG